MNKDELKQFVEDNIDLLAAEGRQAWNEYAQKTLSKCPKSMISPWEETGEWGREGNRQVARSVIFKFIDKVFENAS